MNNNLVLSLAVSVIPILAIAFVGILLLHKIYVKIRSKFNVTVNCWFCNQNARVPYLEANSWTCPHCEQYNGFTKDGDYNREIFQQLDCSNTSNGSGSGIQGTSEAILGVPRNGFCNVCNEAQRLKVEKLAQFEPKNESRFDEELKTYKAQLEEQYRLCSTCDRHLKKVLREKKKMVLGSKFLDFIIKGAETLKQPHFSQLRYAKQQQWKRHLALQIGIWTALNMCCLCSLMPTLRREQLTTLLGETFGQQLFIGCSHIVALGRVLASYLDVISTNATVEKFSLFVRTLYMMLLYTMGLKMPQIARINFASLYTLSCPFALLALAFGYNLVDGFRLTRFTFLMALWSAFAGGLIEDRFAISQYTLMFLASLLTAVLSLTSRVETSPKLHDTTASSFHKIYSEDYMSDEDTISLLSQQLNYSYASSNQSTSLGATSSPSASLSRRTHLPKSRFTSSTLSLHQMPHTPFSPNSSFKSCCLDTQSSAATLRPQYASSVCDLSCAPTTTTPLLHAPLFASNLELNCRERPHSAIFGRSADNSFTAHNNSFMSSCSFRQQPPKNALHADPCLQQQRLNKTAMNDSMSDCFSFATASAMPLRSPFSLQQQTTGRNLLSPSRFSATVPASNTATSWLSGGYFNQRQICADAKTREHRQGVSTIEENLSRASSQSSGFESQNGRLNVSRENSFCPDAGDFLQRTKSAFQPIDSSGRDFTPRPSLLSTNGSVTQPLSVNCSLASPFGQMQSELWKAPTRRRNLTHDSFNLRTINEELPTIRRGDLLKKWKETQAVS